jgi:hypothetical protein
MSSHGSIGAKFSRGTPPGKLPVEWPSTNPEPGKILGIMVPSRVLEIGDTGIE